MFGERGNSNCRHFISFLEQNFKLVVGCLSFSSCPPLRGVRFSNLRNNSLYLFLYIFVLRVCLVSISCATEAPYRLSLSSPLVLCVALRCGPVPSFVDFLHVSPFHCFTTGAIITHLFTVCVVELLQRLTPHAKTLPTL